MDTLIAAFVAFGLVMVAMAVGVIFISFSFDLNWFLLL